MRSSPRRASCPLGREEKRPRPREGTRVERTRTRAASSRPVPCAPRTRGGRRLPRLRRRRRATGLGPRRGPSPSPRRRGTRGGGFGGGERDAPKTSPSRAARKTKSRAASKSRDVPGEGSAPGRNARYANAASSSSAAVWSPSPREARLFFFVEDVRAFFPRPRRTARFASSSSPPAASSPLETSLARSARASARASLPTLPHRSSAGSSGSDASAAADATSASSASTTRRASLFRGAQNAISASSSSSEAHPEGSLERSPRPRVRRRHPVGNAAPQCVSPAASPSGPSSRPEETTAAPHATEASSTSASSPAKAAALASAFAASPGTDAKASATRRDASGAAQSASTASWRAFAAAGSAGGWRIHSRRRRRPGGVKVASRNPRSDPERAAADEPDDPRPRAASPRNPPPRRRCNDRTVDASRRIASAGKRIASAGKRRSGRFATASFDASFDASPAPSRRGPASVLNLAPASARPAAPAHATCLMRYASASVATGSAGRGRGGVRVDSREPRRRANHVLAIEIGKRRGAALDRATRDGRSRRTK